MTAQALWLPGEFPTTNRLLDIQRASGFYDGHGAVTGARRRKNALDFNKVVSEIRQRAKLQALGARLRPVTSAVPLLFVHLGSGRRDPSSWYLSAKAVEDGLVDARVLASDRFCVTATAGRCAKASDPWWRAEIARLTGVDPEGKEGMFVCLGVPDGLSAF